jgi:hypothetical protein
MFELLFVVCTLGSTPEKITGDGQCWVAMDQPLFKTELTCRHQTEKLLKALEGAQFPVHFDYVCKATSAA